MLRALTPAGTRDAIPDDVLFERLLLIAYGYGTNSGLRTVAAGDHGHSEEDLRYSARRYFTPTGLKAAGVEIANATFAARQARALGGWHHHRRVGLHPLRRLRPQHLHRVALPLRRPGDLGVLER